MTKSQGGYYGDFLISKADAKDFFIISDHSQAELARKWGWTGLLLLIMGCGVEAVSVFFIVRALMMR